MATAVGFGYKMQWLAVRDRRADTVAATLRLGRPTAAAWPEAVAAAYRGDWLLTPPVDGWTLAASAHVPAPENERFAGWLAGLSNALGDVQYFGTHRVVEYHGWGRASDGVVQRAYAYLGERGETLFEVGEPSADERALGFRTGEDNFWLDDDELSLGPREEIVLALAGRWSVDPRSLEGATISGQPLTAVA